MEYTDQNGIRWYYNWKGQMVQAETLSKEQEGFSMQMEAFEKARKEKLDKEIGGRIAAANTALGSATIINPEPLTTRFWFKSPEGEIISIPEHARPTGILPSVANLPPTCSHKWKATVGLFSIWHDCELCGVKQENT